MRKLIDAVRRCWSILRRATNDDAYERYLTHAAAHHSHAAPLTRAQFFKQEQERKWAGIKRCC